MHEDLMLYRLGGNLEDPVGGVGLPGGRVASHLQGIKEFLEGEGVLEGGGDVLFCMVGGLGALEGPGYRVDKVRGNADATGEFSRAKVRLRHSLRVLYQLLPGVR